MSLNEHIHAIQDGSAVKIDSAANNILTDIQPITIE